MIEDENVMERNIELIWVFLLEHLDSRKDDRSRSRERRHHRDSRDDDRHHRSSVSGFT